MYTVTPSLVTPANPDPVPLGPNQQKGFNLDLARCLRMRRRTAVYTAVVMLVLLLALALTRRPQYQTTSLIYIQPLISKEVTDASTGLYDASRYDSYVQQQILTFARPDILDRTLNQLSPRVRASFASNRELAINQLSNGVKVQRVLGGYQISVSMIGTDPAAITEIVNTITSVYLKNGQQDDLAQSNDQMQALVQERQQIQNELDADRRAQAGLSSALGIADTAPSDNANRYDTQLTDLRAQLAIARNAHQVAEAQLASVQANPTQPTDALNAAADPLTRSDAELAAMKSGIATRRSVLISQMAGLTPSNPLLQQDQKELAQLDQSLQEMTVKLNHQAGQSLKNQLTLEAARTRDVEARLANDLAKQTATATGSTPKLQRASDLAAAILRLQARFTQVDAAVHAISLAQGAAGLAHLSLLATQPTLPMPSKKQAILVLALPFALGFGVLAALLMQKLDPHVYIAQDMTGALNFPPMAVLPDLAEVSPKILEEFVFRLVAGIDQAYRTRDAKTFIFTAVSESTPIKRLVDSLSSEMKMLGYRVITMTASETLAAKSIEAASTWDTGTGLVRSSKNIGLQLRQDSLVVENLERLKQDIDLLFIEALPIRSSSEAEFMARHGDVTVLIAQSGRTTRHELKNSLALLRRLSVRGLVAALTDLRLCNADDDFIESVHFAKQNESNMRTTTEKLRPQAEKRAGAKTVVSAERHTRDTEKPLTTNYQD
jgi:uncharacterized protein involved in exopolysaccharide biosynthesis